MRRFFRKPFSTALLCAIVHSSSAATPPQRVDVIVRGRYVVTMDAAHRLIEDGAVAVLGSRIVAVDTASSISQRFTALHTVDKPNAAILPGLIDTHTHAPMSLFRAIADDRRLQDWLHNFIFPAESHNVNADFVRWGTRLACLEMLLAGITTYTDMYYFEDVEAETAKEAGVRGVLGQSVIGFPAPDYKTWQEALAATERYIQKFKGDDLITPAVAPHSIYTTPNEALAGSRKLADKYDVPLLIHLAETKTEVDESVAKRGLTPTQVLDQLGVLRGRTVAAHSVWVSSDDLQILERTGTGVAHCPSSNTKLASGIAPVTAMLKLGIHVGLGNDGFAGSNDSANLIREMDLAAKLQKVKQMDPTVVSAEQALEMATIGGARVLGLEKEIGSLEAGKRADLVTLSLAQPHTTPLYNLYSLLVYTAQASDVQDVFINGRQIVRDQQVLTLDRVDILRKSLEYKRQILSSLEH